MRIVQYSTLGYCTVQYLNHCAQESSAGDGGGKQCAGVCVGYRCVRARVIGVVNWRHWRGEGGREGGRICSREDRVGADADSGEAAATFYSIRKLAARRLDCLPSARTAQGPAVSHAIIYPTSKYLAFSPERTHRRAHVSFTASAPTCATPRHTPPARSLRAISGRPRRDVTALRRLGKPPAP